MSDLTSLWIYLSHGPLLWLMATVVAYGVGDYFFQLSGRSPWVNSVLIAMVVLSIGLVASGTSYETYFEGAQFVHFMLGPATVALALPLYTNRHHLKSTAIPMLAALFVSSVVAMGSAVAIAYVFGIRGDILLSLVPKSATSPVAVGVSEIVGGVPTLTAAMVIVTGIIGAVVVTPLYNALGIYDYRARGFATGVAAHGIGTARAFQVSETAGAFAGIGMGMSALMVTFLAPLAVSLFQ
ncbi:MAG: LrgB family protein [Mangrovicoccus sp.]